MSRENVIGSRGGGANKNTIRMFTYPILINQDTPRNYQPMKNISSYIYPTLEVFLVNTLINSYLSSKYFVELMIMKLMLRN